MELPQGRTHSTHSLDLPNSDQPRRASAPEGENITIVIDDVDSGGKSTIIEAIFYRLLKNCCGMNFLFLSPNTPSVWVSCNVIELDLIDLLSQ